MVFNFSASLLNYMLHGKSDKERETNRESVPERMYTVDAAWHVLSVIYVCGFRVEYLKHNQGNESIRAALSAGLC